MVARGQNGVKSFFFNIYNWKHLLNTAKESNGDQQNEKTMYGMRKNIGKPSI